MFELTAFRWPMETDLLAFEPYDSLLVCGHGRVECGHARTGRRTVLFPRQP